MGTMGKDSELMSARKDRTMAEDRAATLYRMVLPDHTCPFGVKAKQILEQHGFKVDDHILFAERGGRIPGSAQRANNAAGIHWRRADRWKR